MKVNSHPSKDIDFRDYLKPYVEFWNKLTEELINEVMKYKKRKFAWRKVQIQVDTRSPTVYGEIKYNRIL